eukprot:3174430-Rhodomonas_salina.1
MHGISTARRTDPTLFLLGLLLPPLFLSLSPLLLRLLARSPPPPSCPEESRCIASCYHVTLGQYRHALGQYRHALGQYRHPLGWYRHALGQYRAPRRTVPCASTVHCIATA